VPVTLGKSPYTLGKGFAECNRRQRSLGKAGDGKGLFADGLLSDTRQRLCRVPVNHSAKKSCLTAPDDGYGRFAECLTGALGKARSLCRESLVLHSAKVAALLSAYM